MPFDGSGNFNRVRNWVNDALAHIKIKSDLHDSEDDNFASGLSNVITKDGQTQPTANIPMNGKKLVNLGAPTVATDAATKGYVDAKPISDVGAIQLFALATPPAGWLKANGAAVSRSTYAALFAAIGSTFGPGDGTTTFNLPDLRGEFIRIWDDARGVDAARVFGSGQAANIEAHTHAIGSHSHTASSGNESVGHTHGVNINTNAAGIHSHSFVGIAGSGSQSRISATTQSGADAFTDPSVSHVHNVSGNTGGASVPHTHAITVDAAPAGTPVISPYGVGTDTRPRNVALLACIRY